ncbi:beta-1,4-mannosyltransferase [Geosmithia morbida]|uniref:Chitobiosyldiphosphodolichol beta-mannosyltransferase n=1 Tax=Geosmithia morbida TaxID=1094350 RepID=A0A9P5D9S5_9HYPO|nr:beta-1,4-mannosyltransferase [Geosmithia morbida]KAF4126829.1 beta-1,4-mannosyltransferase [Geosmithia morbida]
MLFPFIASVVAGGLSVIAARYLFVFVVWLARKSRHIVPTRYAGPAQESDHDHIQILVVGDIGRSPRMQYHGISLAKHGRYLTPPPEWIAWGTLPLLAIPYKVIHQFCTLFYTLMYATPPARWIIIQNPPSIPAFHVAMLVAYIRGSKVLVDWHNYGHTLLRETLLLRPLVPLYRWYEKGFGRRLGDANLAVTDAMARQLRSPLFGIETPVLTLHDRPAETFRPISPSSTERLDFLSRLPETKKDAGDIVAGAVRLVVSSTSWTADEDFGLLLDALIKYSGSPDPTRAGEHGGEPAVPILAIITGKGPQKKAYTDKIAELQDQGRLPGIRILTAWLSTRDYATLLACADLGVSLHKSSSGVDLPMKVVDMFGAGLPVAAYSAFESFGELIKEGQNGCGFETADQLAEVLLRLLSDKGGEELSRLKEGAVREGSLRWDDEWDRVVGSILGLDQI